MSAPIAKNQLNFELPQLSYVDASLEEANLRAPAPPRKSRGLVATLVAAFRTWQDKRAALFDLDRMTDRELADIGLNRGDIYRVTHFG
jgi:uncharacterized protein YjiS (DUF1127 family)